MLWSESQENYGLNLDSKANSSLILYDLIGFGPNFLICIMKISQVLYNSKLLLVCNLIHLGNKFPGSEKNVISAHWLFHICLRPLLTHSAIYSPSQEIDFLFGGNIPKFHLRVTKRVSFLSLIPTKTDIGHWETQVWSLGICVSL